MLLHYDLSHELSILFINKLLLVQVNGFLHDLVSVFSAQKVLHLDFFLFKFFVVFKESVDLVKQMLRELLQLIDMVDGLVVSGNRNDLIVTFALIQHSHHSNNLGLNETQWLDVDTAENKDVKWVVVIAVGHGDESVVGGIVHGTKENSIEFQESTFLVQFVFCLGASRDFNDGIDILRGISSI